MDYSLELLSWDDVICLRVTGTYRRPDDSCVLLDIMMKAITQMNVSKVLLDMRQAEILGGSIGAYLFGMIPRRAHIDPTLFTIASVYSEITSEIETLEAVLTAGGFVFKAFDDDDEALRWLKTQGRGLAP